MNLSARLLVALVAMAATAAWSADLTEAKQAGLVGEREDGYLGIVRSDASEQVQALVKDVNAKRRARYQAVARDNGIALEVVEERAGKTAIGKTRPGHYLKDGDRWRKKAQ